MPPGSDSELLCDSRKPRNHSSAIARCMTSIAAAMSPSPATSLSRCSARAVRRRAGADTVVSGMTSGRELPANQGLLTTRWVCRVREGRSVRSFESQYPSGLRPPLMWLRCSFLVRGQPCRAVWRSPASRRRSRFRRSSHAAGSRSRRDVLGDWCFSGESVLPSSQT